MFRKRIVKVIAFLTIISILAWSAQFFIKPAQANTTVLTNTGSLWGSNRNNIFFNGTNYFVFYDKNSTTLFARASSTVAGLSSATEQTVATLADADIWNMFVVSDTQVDIIYGNTTTTVVVQTCSIATATVSCSAASGSYTRSTSAGFIEARNASQNRMWSFQNGTSNTKSILSANQTGDSGSVTTWRTEASLSNVGSTRSLIPYGSADKILVIYTDTTSNALRSQECTYAAGCTSIHNIIAGNAAYLSAPVSFPIRVSDSEFHILMVDTSVTPNTLNEYQYNGTAWSLTATIDNSGGQTSPVLVYDRISGDMYTFYVDSANHIQRYYKPSGGAWGSKTQVDASEATANSLPAASMYEPPEGSLRISPRQLFWGYRTVNGTNFDLKVDSLQLAAFTPAVVFTNALRTLTAGVCNGAANVLTIQLQDGSGNPTTPTGSTVIRVTSNSPDYTIYSDNTCSTVVTNGDFTFTTSDTTKSVYIIDRRKSATTWTLTAAKQSGPDSITTGTQTITVLANNLNINGGVNLRGGSSL